jgi:hypothetical protein
VNYLVEANVLEKHAVSIFTAQVIVSTNQPEKIAKGGVKRSHETFSLARLDHSCILNALLEMVNGALNCNG